MATAAILIIGVSSAQPTDPTSTGEATVPEGLPPTGEPAAQPAGPEVAPPPISTAPTVPPGSPAGTSVQAIREGHEEDVSSYAIQLRDLEQQINQLKQEVFRSKARLAQLAENVIQGTGGGRSKIRLIHRNQMGGTFQLVKLSYFLDRSPVYNQVDESGDLGEIDEANVYESIITPGDHTVSVEIEYRGYGHGIFSYLQGYRFRVNSSHTFTIAGGKEMTIEGVGFEQGGPLTAIEDRPSIRFTEQVRDLAGSADASSGER